MPAQPKQPTTQNFLEIHDITNNLVLLKDGTATVILTVNAMNFGLLAEEEQDAIMYAYAGLLNSINYPIQIVIQSKTKDVTSYLRRLRDQESKTGSEIMRKRISTYRQFVANLIHERNVLDKRFYVTIPASPIEMGFLTTQGIVPGTSSFDINAVEKSVLIEKATNLLEPKKDHLITQFGRIGLYSRQLETQEIIQLFYNNYNPEATEGYEIADSRSYGSALVTADITQPFENSAQIPTNRNTTNSAVQQSLSQSVASTPTIAVTTTPANTNPSPTDYASTGVVTSPRGITASLTPTPNANMPTQTLQSAQSSTASTSAGAGLRS